ncbi:hypothetical protein BDZ89DRAFT_982421 [Hymenopellis radicata]|nr:hypothetical protein BDZ89DRAFT_982421 [Hymenopellis radicata]
MALSRHFLTRRDAVVIIIVLSAFYFVSALYIFPPTPIITSTDIHSNCNETNFNSSSLVSQGSQLPQTQVIAHAPGWTLFRDLYMANGTLYILSSNESSHFPEIRKMISVSMKAEASPENIAAREPTEYQMTFITPDTARRRWGLNNDTAVRVSTVSGNTLLFNDPPQFLAHYYHFVAELLVGTKAFLHGAFSAPFLRSSPHIQRPLYTQSQPSFDRAIFMHSDAKSWRDGPGFNAYFLRAAFPSITVEVSDDWQDRVDLTLENTRAWHFPTAFLADRSSAFRGDACGSRTQRTAAEAWEFMVSKGALDLFGKWWDDVRTAVTRFAGGSVDSEQQEEEVRIVYVSRQGGRRRLIQEDHERLVRELTSLVARKRALDKPWVLDIVEAQRMSKDEQIRLFSKATILLGVHGNGLSHLVLMNPQSTSTVIEIFFPQGFAHDYEWTTRALGMKHYGIWNDTYFTHSNHPRVNYPEGFQGEAIPAYAPTIVKLIENRLEGRM